MNELRYSLTTKKAVKVMPLKRYIEIQKSTAKV